MYRKNIRVKRESSAEPAGLKIKDTASADSGVSLAAAFNGNRAPISRNEKMVSKPPVRHGIPGRRPRWAAVRPAHPMARARAAFARGPAPGAQNLARAPASARLLLGDAVHVSAAVHYLQRVHAHHFLIRENGGKLLQRQGVVFIAELRHNDAAVHNEEI